MPSLLPRLDDRGRWRRWRRFGKHAFRELGRHRAQLGRIGSHRLDDRREHAGAQDAEGQAGDELAKELKLRARADVAAFASPDTFHWAPTGLPKTRSGKIMRRILRKIAAEGAEVSGLGDTSTLADPGIVDELIASHSGASK